MARYVYTGNPNTKPRKVAGPRTATGRTSKKRYTLTGGPWHGHKVLLSEPSNVVMRIGKGWHGRYAGTDRKAGGREDPTLDWCDVA